MQKKPSAAVQKKPAAAVQKKPAADEEEAGEDEEEEEELEGDQSDEEMQEVEPESEEPPPSKAQWHLVHSRIYQLLTKHNKKNMEPDKAKKETSLRLALLKIEFFNGVDVETREKTIVSQL